MPSAASAAASDGQTGQEINAASSVSASAPTPGPMPTTLEYKKQQAAVRNLILKRIEIEKRLVSSLRWVHRLSDQSGRYGYERVSEWVEQKR